MNLMVTDFYQHQEFPITKDPRLRAGKAPTDS
jgi:hypothetical protein